MVFVDPGADCGGREEDWEGEDVGPDGEDFGVDLLI